MSRWQNPSQPEDLSKDSQYSGRVQVSHTETGRSTLTITDLRETDSAQYHFTFRTRDFEWTSSLPGTTLTVTGVRGQNCNTVIYTDRSICATKGSSVVISSTYNSYGNITSKFWFRSDRRHQWQNPSKPEDLSKDSQYSGRVQVSHTETGRSTLTITDLRETDSAQYHFTFRTRDFEWTSSLPGTTLTVTGLRVQVIRLTVQESHTEAELECHSSCRSAARLSYVWFKNGEKIPKEANSYKDQFYPGDVVSCALKGHEDYSSPSVYALKVPSVSVSPQSDIMEGGSVTLTCSSDSNSATNYTWYKKNQTEINKEPQLVFSSIQSSDSGHYYCTVENELGRRTSKDVFINVEYPPKVPSVSVSPSAEIVEGSSVTLTCSSDRNSAATYTWYKNQTEINKEPQLVFSSIQSSDSGQYYCIVENELGRRTSEDVFINVKCVVVLLITVFLLVRKWRTSKQSYETGEKPDNIEQDVEPYASVYFCNNQADVTYSNIRPDGDHRHKRNKEEDCVVYSDVSFNRAASSSERRHQWQNPSQPEDLSKDSQYSGRVQVSHTETGRSTLTITDLRETDSAQYHFTFRTRDFEWTSSLPGTTLTVTGVRGQTCNTVIYTDRSICAFKGSSVNISCTYSSFGFITSKFWFRSDRRHQWQNPSKPEDLSKDSQYSGRVQVSHTETGRSTLTITDLRETDSAQYHFTFRTRDFEWTSSLPGTTLTVTGLRVQVIRLTVQESHTEAELECHSSCRSAARLSYVWFKNGEKILKEANSYKDQFYPGDVVSCALKGHEDYSSPSVYPAKVPSVSVSPSAEIVEGSSVNLTCSSDSNPSANYTWYKKNQTEINKEPQLVFRSIQSSDSGQYYYPPKVPSVSVIPSAEIVEGSSVTLTCSSDSNPAANYTWYKENEDSAKASGQIFTITDFRPEHSGNYYCEAQNTRGRQKSASYVIDVAGKSVIMNIIRLAVVILIPLLVLCLWMRKKNLLSPKSDLNAPVEMMEREREKTEREDSSSARGPWEQENVALTELTTNGHAGDYFESRQSNGQSEFYLGGVEDAQVRIRGHLRTGTERETDDYGRNNHGLTIYTKILWLKNHHDGETGRYIDNYPLLDWRGATMSLSAAATGFIVVLLSTSVTHGENNWGVTYSPTEICVLEGSTVDIHCRLQFSRDENNCSLRITDVRQSDSDVYYFRFITNHQGGRYTGEPGVTLTVKALQIYRFPSMTQLTCHSSCGRPDHPSYIWYKNGQKTQGQTSLYPDKLSPTDSYTCAVKGREDFPSFSVCGEKEQTCNTVIYNDRRICVFKGSSVDISCTYSSVGFITSKFWFSSERRHQWQNPSQPEDLSKDSQYSGRVQVSHTETGRSTLTITDLRETDSAQYHFTFRTRDFEWTSSLPGTTLTVTDPDLQVIVIRYSTRYKLKCHSSCRLPLHSSYIWYKNGEKMRNQEEISIFVYYSTDSYSCAVKGHEGFPSPSVCVDGQTCNTVIYTDRSICATKGSSVDISCSYTSVGFITTKFWFRSDRRHQWQNPSQPEDLRKDSQYSGLRVQVIRLTVQESHTEAELECHSSCRSAARLSYVWFKNGEKILKEANSYKDQFYPGDVVSCALKGHEDYSSPSVYSLKVPSVSVSPQSDIMEGGSLTLTCSSDSNPSANYTWYKKNQTEINKEPQLVFRSIQSSDSGQYYCTVENELGRRTSEDVFINVEYPPKVPSVSVSPSAEIVEGSSVNLTCSSDSNPAANYTWYKKKHQRAGGIYHFSSITPEDSGMYYCTSENQPPKVPSVSVSPSAEIVEGSSVTLTCSSDSNPAANYTWYKENEDSAKASGQIFTITDFRPEHSGNYYCEAQNTIGRQRSKSYVINVAGAWKSTAAGATVAVLLVVILLFVFIFIRIKRSSKLPSEPGERPDNRDESQQEQQDTELHYASIQFNNQTDSVYSNIRAAQPHKHEEEEDVEYATVKCSSGSVSSRIEETEDDIVALYSTVNKKSKTKEDSSAWYLFHSSFY
ncbi:hypothetical protein Q5P01_025638 [Channa striata]|uniref:Ig-like domain-containing protein n=1 Tax=Channa striata TaxID=64152 RepID=A0AA88IN14_CHASR|nr:hypothetical protein Q5P01_025638 [Channa striata]